MKSEFSLKLMFLIFLICAICPGTLHAQMGDYSSHHETGTGFVVIAGEDTLIFRLYASDIVRVDYIPEGSARPDSSYTVVKSPDPSVPFTLSESGDSLVLATSALSVVVARNPVRLSYRNTAGEPLLSEPAQGGFTEYGIYRTANFVLPPDLRFYGSGERGIGIDLRGHKFSTMNQAHYAYSGPLETMKINVPFFGTSSGFALYFESPIPADVDLGSSDPDLFSYQIDGGELSLFFLVASDLPGQIERYTWLSGRQPLPPEWALGYIQSKYGYRNRSEAETMVETMRNRGIPADAIVLDLYWFSQMGDLAWNTVAFPDPAGMVDHFLDAGFKTIVITEPYFTEWSSHFPFLANAGSMYVGRNLFGDPYRLGGWWSCGCDALLLDITHPDAQIWLQGAYEDFMQAGVAGVWTDLGEPERHPHDMYHAAGSMAEVHNIYNLLWAKTIYEGFTRNRPNERVVNLTRSGYAGIQRYGVFTWSGDVARSFDGLAVQLPILINSSLSGLGYHSSDLGGFTGTASPELFIRWMQFGAFNPVMRAHGVDNQMTEPWGFGRDAEAIVTDYIRLRYRLLPYIYSLARENCETGMPIVRPLFFSDPDDPQLFDRDDAYLFGPDFLVAPVVVEGEREKSVYLPNGDWIDYWTDSLFSGGATVTVEAPLDCLPLFVRAGAIVPMRPVVHYVGEKENDTLFLHVYPAPLGETESFILYEDDGMTREYQQGEYATTTLSQSSAVDGADSLLTITIGAAAGSFPDLPGERIVRATVHRRGGEPARVILGPDSLAAYSSESELLQSGEGYFHDSSASLLTIQFRRATSASAEIEIANRPAGEPERFFLCASRPNPFSDRVEITFTIPEPSVVKLEIYTVQGRRAALLFEGEKGAGENNVFWDGRNDAGDRCAPGVYFCMFCCDGDTYTSKLVLLR